MQLPALLYLLGLPNSSVGKESTCNVGNPSLILGWGRSTAEGIDQSLVFSGFPCGSAGKESTCNAVDLILSLGQENPLEKEIATHSSILVYRFPWTEEPGWL